MALFGCENRRSCVGLAAVVSLIIGIVAAFLRITAVITVGTAFLWAAFGIAVAYLTIAFVSVPRQSTSQLAVLLAGILGTVFFSLLLLAVPFAATSIVGAIVVGLLLFFFSLMITVTACLVRFPACRNS